MQRRFCDGRHVLRFTAAVQLFPTVRSQPDCAGRMRLISFIEDPTVIRAILTHLGLWSAPARAGPRATVAMNRLEAFAREAELDTDGVDPSCPID